MYENQTKPDAKLPSKSQGILGAFRHFLGKNRTGAHVPTKPARSAGGREGAEREFSSEGEIQALQQLSSNLLRSQSKAPLESQYAAQMTYGAELAGISAECLGMAISSGQAKDPELLGIRLLRGRVHLKDARLVYADMGNKEIQRCAKRVIEAFGEGKTDRPHS